MKRMKLYESIDEYYLSRCLTLARLGEGMVSPNPMVGAIVLDAEGRKVGEGYHAKAGGPHAEVVALNQAGDAAAGGTLYINLEPCNHTGKTPPCTRRIIDAKIDRVICGTLDPNPQVSGTGRDELQNNRISVRYGYLEEECYRLNEVFFHHITTNRPFVALKQALTLDGKIATRSGQSQWLTGQLSRQYVHHLRHRYDAILTSAETVRADNPKMTVRGIPNLSNNPVRVVLDRRFRLDPDKYQIFDTHSAPTWVFTSRIEHFQDNAEKARDRGVKVIEVDETGLGLNLKEVLDYLGQQKITSVFVEAGSKLSGSLLNQNLINKFYLFYAPRAIPDPMAKSAFADSLTLLLPEAPYFHITHTRRLENDLVVEAYPGKKPAALKPYV